MMEESRTISLNGTKFRIKETTFNRLTLSSKLFKQEVSRARDMLSNEILIERHAESFHAILPYFQSRELHLPPAVCPGMFQRELEYWGVGSDQLSNCCRYKFIGFEEHLLAIAKFDCKPRADVGGSLKAHKQTRWGNFRARVWNILDVPSSSKLAKVYFLASMAMIFLSVFCLCAGTLPVFRRELDGDEWSEVGYPLLQKIQQLRPSEIWKLNILRGNASSKQTIPRGNASENPPLDIKARVKILDTMDLICVAFFTIELFFRLLFCPSLKSFLKSPTNIIDIVANLSMYSMIIINEASPIEKFKYCSIDFLQLMNVVRTVRLFRAVKDLVGFRVLITSLWSSVKELLVFSAFMFIATIIFASMLYFTENNEDVKSIPHACWWAIITMTTVGYGDVTPKSPLGMVVGVFCALSGVLLIATIIPVFVNNFVFFNNYAKCARAVDSKRRPSYSAVEPEVNSSPRRKDKNLK